MAKSAMTPMMSAGLKAMQKGLMGAKKNKPMKMPMQTANNTGGGKRV
jgi:hypothetical protein